MDGGRKAAETRQRKLRQAQSFWLQTPHVSVPHDAFPQARHYDAIIVGAGVSGALMADALARARKRVLVVDRREPVRGSTPASTAMIQHEIDLRLAELSRQIGRDRAERAWRRSERAVGDLARLIRRRGLSEGCGFRMKRALYLAGPEAGAGALKAEAEARRAAGIGAEFLTAAALRGRFGIERAAAILSGASASANPAQMTAGILNAARGRRVEVASPVEIADMVELPGGVALATREGRVLTAGHVVFCTGYEYLPQMESAAHRIISTWALASEPGIARPGWLDDHLVWEAADPYLYFRAAKDGRIIAGGEDEEDPASYRDRAKLRAKARAIAGKLGDVCGLRIGRPAYAWAAPFGATGDGLPIIDLVPGMKRTFAVMGFGGNGITYAMIAAQVVTARIAGRDDPDADLYRFR